MANRELENKGGKAGSKSISYLINLIKYLIVIAIVYFVIRKIIANWQDIKDFDWQINPFLLSASILLHQIALVVYSKMWSLVLNSFGHNLPLKYAFRISNLTNLGRYIPGKIWAALGAIYLLRPFGINKELAFASWILTTIFILPPAFLLGFAAILLYPQTLSYIGGFGIWSILALAVIVFISVFIVFFPDKAADLFNRIIGKFGRPPINFAFGRITAIKIFSGYLIGWVIYGFAFYTFLNSIMIDPGIPIAVGIGSFILAYVIGYLAIFSPGGFGVRELVLMAILSSYFGPLTAGIAGIARVWNIISEVVSALIALAIKPAKNK